MSKKDPVARSLSLNVPKFKIYKAEDVDYCSTENEACLSDDSNLNSRYKLRSVLTTDKAAEEKET